MKDKIISKKQFEVFWEIHIKVSESKISHKEWIPLQKNEYGQEFGDYYTYHKHPDGTEIELYGKKWTVPFDIYLGFRNFWHNLLNSKLPKDEQILYPDDLSYLGSKWHILSEIYMLDYDRDE